MEKANLGRLIFTALNLAAAGALIYVVATSSVTVQPDEVPWSQFLAEVRAGNVAEVQISDRKFTATLKPAPAAGKTKTRPRLITAVRLPSIDETSIVQELEAHQVRFSGSAPSSPLWWYLLLSAAVPLIFLVYIYRAGMQRLGQGSAMTFGKNRAKIHDESERLTVTFADVAGVDEAKAELVEVVDFLKHPARYQKLGGRIPKGVLLVGPPGTGKTLLAKAVAGEAGVSFFSISGSEFVEMFVGVGAARVRDLFEQAKLKAPCIVFIDELDAIGKSRSAGGVMLNNDEREQTLNQLLAEMDGFDTSEGVIIMAATNTPEVLDPALLRGGRFDRQVMVGRPDLTGREAILQLHARKLKAASALDLHAVASRTPGMVGSDLATLVNEAALLAARRGAAEVAQRDFDEAIDRVMLGLEKKRQVMTPDEKERVAFHESGHALVALSVQNADPVLRVSIIPRSIGSLGYTLQLPLEERFLMTRSQIEDQLAVMLGGRAAEEIVYKGVVSTGAANDLERASELARQAVTRFGMSERLGPLTWGVPQAARYLAGPLMPAPRNYSEHTARLIDHEVRAIVDNAYTRVTGILTLRQGDLRRMAAELVRKETLDRPSIDRLLSEAEAPAPPPQPAAAR